MWLFIFFDIPVVTKSERKKATKFRQFLLKDGFVMLQYSVYARICNGNEGVEKHLKRLTSNLPDVGNIRSMQVTDSQFNKMQIHVGEKKPEEKKIEDVQLAFF